MLKYSLLRAIIMVSLQLLLCQGYMYLQPVMFGEGECIDDEWIAHPIGSVWYDKEKCEKMKCIFSRDIMYIQVYGCGAMGYPDECWLVPGKGENYPSCCPQVECLNLGILQ